MTRKADETGLLKTMNHGDLIDDLSSACRNVKGGKDTTKSTDGHWVHTLPSVMDEMIKLGIVTDTKPKGKRGRPPKEKKISDAPKRPRGRPPKPRLSPTNWETVNL